MVTEARKIRVMIADDHPIFRDGLRRLLRSEADMEVATEATDGTEVAERVRTVEPDVLLLDLAMPRRPGLDALRDLTELPHPARTIVLTAAIEEEQIVEALQLGARGIVLKDSATEILFLAIRTVMKDLYWVGREVVSDIVEYLRRKQANRPSPKDTFELTRRERQIISLVLAGRSNREIARHYSISEETVKHHLTSSFDKCGVSSRLELALFALKNRLVDNP